MCGPDLMHPHVYGQDRGTEQNLVRSHSYVAGKPGGRLLLLSPLDLLPTAHPHHRLPHLLLLFGFQMRLVYRATSLEKSSTLGLPSGTVVPGLDSEVRADPVRKSCWTPGDATVGTVPEASRSCHPGLLQFRFLAGGDPDVRGVF